MPLRIVFHCFNFYSLSSCVLSSCDSLSRCSYNCIYTLTGPAVTLLSRCSYNCIYTYAHGFSCDSLSSCSYCSAVTLFIQLFVLFSCDSLSSCSYCSAVTLYPAVRIIVRSRVAFSAPSRRHIFRHISSSPSSQPPSCRRTRSEDNRWKSGSQQSPVESLTSATRKAESLSRWINLELEVGSGRRMQVERAHHAPFVGFYNVETFRHGCVRNSKTSKW